MPDLWMIMPLEDASLGDIVMPLQVLEPLQMACVMDVPRIAEPALGCLHKLVSRPAQPKHISQLQKPAAIFDNVPYGDMYVQVAHQRGL